MGSDRNSVPLLPVDSALRQLLDRATPIPEIEKVSLNDALGRVTATALTAPVDVPPCDNSAMDGYAIRCEDLSQQGTTTLPITQRIAAGDTSQPLALGSAARIFTGAPIPSGADAVVPQEQCTAKLDQVTISVTVHRGQHIRSAGEDIARGNTFLEAGCRISPQTMGVIAANGIASLRLVRRLKVALLSTGNELLEPGESPRNGKLYNSNHFTLTGLLQALGCETIDCGTVRDDLSATIAILDNAASQADLIVSSGGVSVGEEDHVRNAIERLGKLTLWRLNIKPGKPLAFGRIHNTPFFGLPGNPVSLFVTFVLFTRPFIMRMQGITAIEPLTLKARARFSHPKKGSRQEYLRSRISTTEDGIAVTTFGKQGSGVLSSTLWADSLTIIPPQAIIEPGDLVDVIPFSELIQ